MRPVILVSMDWRRPQDGKTSLGIASIAAALKNASVPVFLIEETINDPNFSVERVLEQVNCAVDRAGADCLVGFGVYVWNDDEVCTLLGKLRSTCGINIVLGGPQISYMPKGQLEHAYPEASYFVRGQGEKAMVQLAMNDDLHSCGIHIAGTTDQGLKADHDLEELPSPYLTGLIEPSSSIRWETQRGCPFKCSFCQHREPGNRLKNKMIGSQRLEKEAELFARSGVERISILDPIFHVNNRKAIQRLASFKRVGLKAQLSLQCRLEMVTPEFLDALEGLNIFLEFGLQTVVPDEYKAIGRPNNLRKADLVIRELHKRNIDFEISLIYGLPLQTLASFKESINWCQERGVTQIRAWPLMLLRGTPLYEEKLRYGFKESVDQSIPIVIAGNSFTEDEHKEMAILAEGLNS